MVMGIIFTNMTQWCFSKAKATRSGTHWEIFGPVYYVAIATVTSLMFPMATLFIYVGRIGYPGSKMWTGGSFFPNKAHGIILYILKFVGTGFLMVGISQITNLHTKIINKWRIIRGQKEVQVTDGGSACGAGG